MFEYQPAKLHTKLLVFDDVVHIGSANFDFRSLYLNLEMMLRIEDAGFAEQMRGYFERELADCQEITPGAASPAGALVAQAEVGAIQLPGDRGRLYGDAAAQLRARRLRRLSASLRHAQKRVAGGTLTHSNPRSRRSKTGAMKSRTLGLN